jgi:hypothetical protein
METETGTLKPYEKIFSIVGRWWLHVSTSSGNGLR